MKPSKKALTIVSVSLVLISLTFITTLTTSATDFLVDASERMMASLAAVNELKIAANTGSTSHIPFISGASRGVIDSLDKVFNYLILSNAIVSSQIVIISLSKSFLLKLLTLIFIAGLFVKKFQKISFKVLIIALMLNPGLPLYVNALKYVSIESNLDLGISLHQELEKTHEAYKKKEAERNQKHEARNQRQLEEAQKKGKDEIGLIKRAEDKVSDTISSGAYAIGEEFHDSIDVIRVAGKKLVELMINTMVSIIIVFLVLPIAYIYLIKLVLSRTFHFDINLPLLSEATTKKSDPNTPEKDTIKK